MLKGVMRLIGRRTHTFLAALVTGVAIVVSAPVAADGLATLLGKMSSAGDNVNYEGVFVLRRSDNLMSMRVVHGVDERGTWESMETMNGEMRSVVRHNEEVISIYPERKHLTITHNEDKSSLHPALPENLDKISLYYTISDSGMDRVAGRETRVIELKPVDKFRYGYRYWLDADTGVLLKCDTYDEEGSVIEQMMYTEMRYSDEVPRNAFTAIDMEGYSRQKLGDQREKTERAGWRVADLPEGFMLTHSSTRNEDDTASTLHLVYSDGLASVSVFIEPESDSPHKLDGASSMGPLNAYSRQINGSRVMVMGEVPVATVTRIAQTLESVY